MKELEHIHFTSGESFRSWLETNFDKSSGIWIIFYKKHITIECIQYDEALEEALCFGWIDSIIKKIDNYLKTGKVDWKNKELKENKKLGLK